MPITSGGASSWRDKHRLDTDRPEPPPPERFAQILKIAVLVWNAVVLDDHRGTVYLSQTRSQLRLIKDPRSREFMLALLDDLANRKRAEFSEHLWLVGDWKILDQPGGFPCRSTLAISPPPPGADANLQPPVWPQRLPEQ